MPRAPGVRGQLYRESHARDPEQDHREGEGGRAAATAPREACETRTRDGTRSLRRAEP